MIIPDITIAVDGYSSTGKSTFAKLVAKVFSFLYLDSGAMYRGVTLFAQENGLIDADSNIDLDGLKAALDKGLDIHFEHTEEGCKTFIGERCVEKEIRSMTVSSQVSPQTLIKKGGSRCIVRKSLSLHLAYSWPRRDLAKIA